MKSIVDDVANKANLRGRRVWCLRCGHTTVVDHGLRDGWPKCCDHTMTIDDPATRTR